MNKGTFFLAMLVLSLLLISPNHLKLSFGDSIFQFIGIPAWTREDNSGIHISVLIGFMLLIIGLIGSANHFRPRFPKISSRLVVGCIIFFLSFPSITKGSMYLLKYKSDGLDSIDISNGKCSFESVENKVSAHCNLHIFNYGEVDIMAIRPILPSYLDELDIEFEQNRVSLDRHSNTTMGMIFNGIQHNGAGFTGSSQSITFEIEVISNSK